MRKAYLGIDALFENTWTGIPNVVAAIAEGAMNDPDIDWTFLYETIEIPKDLVRTFLKARSGKGGLSALEQLVWEQPPISRDVAAEGVGVYTNIKPMRRFFGYEASILYDLSPLLTPQFHSDGNVSHFSTRFRDDVASSDHLFCISQACLSDVATYFGTPTEKMSIIEMGVDFDPADLTAAGLGLGSATRVEPYIAVLGTLEPRKNGRMVLDYLAENPRFATRFRVVFVGREGWLDGRGKLMEALTAAGVSQDRVIFTGYVSETEKTMLLLNAAFCVYPSFFEGYGLPVLEASALGKITVCSNSSSIPEVFPENCVFFNPLESFEFARAMKFAEIRAAQTRAESQSLSDLIDRTAPYGWQRCYPGIAGWVKEQ